LSQLLRTQIKLGYELQQQVGINTVPEFGDIVGKALSRDSEWLDIYSREILEKDLDPTERDRSENVENKMIAAAKAEIAFGSALWDNRYNDARAAFEAVVADVARGDSRLSGWFNLWIGYCYDVEGDTASAQLDYQRAKQKLGHAIALPRGSLSGPGYNLNTNFQEKMRSLLLCTPEAYERQQRLYAVAIAPLRQPGHSVFDKEEAARTLGEYFGFEARRPDNEEKGRPDVVWIDNASNQLLGFELKTEKGSSSPYNMDDVSKGHNYIEWIKRAYPQHQFLGLIYVGPRTSVTQEATPSSEMYICELADLAALANDFQIPSRHMGLYGFKPYCPNKAGRTRTIRTSCDIWPVVADKALLVAGGSSETVTNTSG